MILTTERIERGREAQNATVAEFIEGRYESEQVPFVLGTTRRCR